MKLFLGCAHVQAGHATDAIFDFPHLGGKLTNSRLMWPRVTASKCSHSASIAPAILVGRIVNGPPRPLHKGAETDFHFIALLAPVNLGDASHEGLDAIIGSTVTLRAGDVMVQRGTNHSWVNRSKARARLSIVLVDAKPLGIGHPRK